MWTWVMAGDDDAKTDNYNVNMGDNKVTMGEDKENKGDNGLHQGIPSTTGRTLKM